MTQREEFDDWCYERVKSGRGYDMFDVWKASRAVALEDALIACNGEALEDPTESADDIAYDHAVDDCRNAIKKLKGKA